MPFRYDGVFSFKQMVTSSFRERAWGSASIRESFSRIKFNTFSLNFCVRSLVFPIHGGYTKWNNWTSCSQTCGGGLKQRSRSCTNPRPANKGRNCSVLGPATETKRCRTQRCPGKVVSLHLSLYIRTVSDFLSTCYKKIKFHSACKCFADLNFVCYFPKIVADWRKSDMQI